MHLARSQLLNLKTLLDAGVLTQKEFDDNTTFRKEMLKTSKEELISSVFDILDLDGSGVFTVGEIQMMLVNWGCPASDAKKAMLQLGLGPEKEVDSSMFKEHFYDVWHFCLVSLKEFATFVDDRMQRPDGSPIPFDDIHGNTIFNDSRTRLASRASSAKISPY